MPSNNRTTNNQGGLSAQNAVSGKQEYLQSIGQALKVAPAATADVTSTGTISALNGTVSINVIGLSTVGIQVTGSFTATLTIQGTTDGSTWSPTTVVSLSNGTIQSSITGPFNGQANVAGLSALRLIATAYTSGTATVTLRGSIGISTVILDNPLPTGSNIIGKVGIDQTTPGTTNGVTITDGTNTASVVTGVGKNGLATATTPATVNTGQQTVNTTAVQISAVSTVPTNGIIIGALSTNAASIFIGGSSVTTSIGAELTPGSSLPFTCNLNTLYIISASSTTDKIWWDVA